MSLALLSPAFFLFKGTWMLVRFSAKMFFFTLGVHTHWCKYLHCCWKYCCWFMDIIVETWILERRHKQFCMKLSVMWKFMKLNIKLVKQDSCLVLYLVRNHRLLGTLFTTTSRRAIHCLWYLKKTSNGRRPELSLSIEDNLNLFYFAIRRWPTFFHKWKTIFFASVRRPHIFWLHKI